jgi:hypothetical protein
MLDAIDVMVTRLVAGSETFFGTIASEMLPWMSSRFIECLGGRRRALDEAVDLAYDEMFEAADDVLVPESLGGPSPQVFRRGRVVAQPAEHMGVSALLAARSSPTVKAVSVGAPQLAGIGATPQT